MTSDILEQDAEVRHCTGDAVIGVDRGDWGDLPPDVAMMVAPPIVVTALPRTTKPRRVPRGPLPRRPRS